MGFNSGFKVLNIRQVSVIKNQFIYDSIQTERSGFNSLLEEGHIN